MAISDYGQWEIIVGPIVVFDFTAVAGGIITRIRGFMIQMPVLAGRTFHAVVKWCLPIAWDYAAHGVPRVFDGFHLRAYRSRSVSSDAGNGAV